MCRFSRYEDTEYKKVIGTITRIVRTKTRPAIPDTIKHTDDDHRQNFLDRLKFDQINARHTTSKTAYTKTCKWLLNIPQYQEWLDDDKILDYHGFLWLKGKPGANKSTLMKFAYANVKKVMVHIIVISFFFNARGEDLEKSALEMYRSLLFQFIDKLPDIQDQSDLLGTSRPGDFDRNTDSAKILFSYVIEQLGQ